METNESYDNKGLHREESIDNHQLGQSSVSHSSSIMDKDVNESNESNESNGDVAEGQGNQYAAAASLMTLGGAEDGDVGSQEATTASSSPIAPKNLFRGKDENQENQKPLSASKLKDAKHVPMTNKDEPTPNSDEESSDDEEEATIGDTNNTDSDSEDDEDDDDMTGLSEYERLRLRNIRRNNARLVQLGLASGSASSRMSSGSVLTNLLTSDSNINAQQQTSQPRKRKQQQAAVPRRSLPRRKCAKLKRFGMAANDGDDADNDNRNGGDADGGYSSDESSVASPVKIQRILIPQSHQQAADEGHLKHYLRTRRVRRGRPKRHEYQYSCKEVCKGCGGEWKFNNPLSENEMVAVRANAEEEDEDDDIEETTRLVRCKDCRGAFHLHCMLGNSDNVDDREQESNEDETKSEEDDERKPAAVSNEAYDDSFELPLRDPKRCIVCDVKHKSEKQSAKSSPEVSKQGSSSTMSLLEATMNDRIVAVRVTPEPALEACVNGNEVRCFVTIGGQTTSRGATYDDAISNSRHENKKAPARRAGVTWKRPIAEKQKIDPTTLKIQKLITKAFSDVDYSQLLSHCCLNLRKYITDEDSTATAVAEGGITMLVSSMEHHPDRPMLLAEAMCTLAEIVWQCPHLGTDTIAAGGLDLVMSAMEQHVVHSQVQQRGCGYLRALSYDGNSCAKMKKSKKVIDAAVRSITRNPKKLNVLMEGSMFIQNMMAVFPTIVKSILRSNRGNTDSQDLLPTLLTAIEMNANDSDLLFSVFGLLLNVSFDAKGCSTLQDLEVVTVAVDAIRDHQDSPELHELAFVLLQNMIPADGESEQQDLVIAQLVLQSMQMHSEEEMIQINGCQLLDTIYMQTDTVRGLVRSQSNMLTLASEKFPDSCKSLVHGLLQGLV